MRPALFAALILLGACNRGDAADPPTSPGPAAAEAQAWLEKNRSEAGVQTTASGLQYKVVRSGPAGGVRANKGDEVKVHYEGTLTDGQVFDSSYQEGVPAVFTVGDLVEGWNEVLTLMRPGDQWLVYVPPELGYGERNMGPIPPNSVLVFRMELLDVLPKGGGVQRG